MDTRRLFRDRTDAGQKLAVRLRSYASRAPVVLGLPRGGVAVAYEVARALGAPLDVCVVRKIGAPMQPELGIGAVAEDGALYVDHDLVKYMGLSDDALAQRVAAKRAEVDARVRAFRRGAPPIDVRQQTVIVVDDGIATGGTARAALQTLRARGAGELVLAVPVAASETLVDLAPLADDVVCLHAAERLYAVGEWYEDFATVTDDVVIDVLARARRDATRPPEGRARSERVPVRVARHVQVPADGHALEGDLVVPPNARGLVLFVHGSGSSRLSPRNQLVAGELQRAEIATLLFDLLTADEERVDARTRELRFDIALLTRRLLQATEWARRTAETSALPLGYFGASTGAAAALAAAAERADVVDAVVSRGGRPDLAEASLGDVKAPTLLLVGGEDAEVLQLNREAMYLLACEKRLEVVPRATHLFEEPGALEHVAASAASWFKEHLGHRGLEAIA